MRGRSALALFGALLFPCSLCTGDEAWFVRGNTNADELVDISDAIETLGYLFLGNDTPTCLDAADANDDGEINIVDPIYLLDHLFRGGRAPPFPTRIHRHGPDPLGDALSCDRSPRVPAPSAGTLYVGAVRTLAPFPDGTRLAFGGDSLGVLAIESGMVLWSVRRAQGDALSVDVSPDGKRIAAGGLWSDGITLWDGETGRLLRVLEYGEPLEQSTRYVEFSSDGTRLLSLYGSRAWLWDLQGNAPSPNAVAPELRVEALAFVAGGDRIVAGGRLESPPGYSLSLVDAMTGSVLETTPFDHRVRAVAANPEGSSFGVATDGYELSIWTVDPWGPVAPPTRAESGYDPTLTFLADSARVVFSGGLDWNRFVDVFDARSTAPIDRFTLGSHIDSLVSTADGRGFICATPQGSITLWDLTTGERRDIVEGFEGVEMDFLGMAFREPQCFAEISPDGSVVAVGADWEEFLPGDAPICFRDAHSGALLRKVQAPLVGQLCDVGIRPGTNEPYFYRDAPAAALYLLDPSSWDVARRIVVDPGPVFRWSGDGETFLVARQDGTISQYAADTGELRSRVHIPNRYPIALWGAEGSARTLVVEPLTRVPILEVWDAVSGERISALDIDGPGGVTAVLTPDGKEVVVWDRDWQVELWDAESGDFLLSFGNYESRDELHLAVSPDGRTVFVSGPTMVEAYRTVDGSRLRGYEIGSIRSYGSPIRVSPDGSRLAMTDGSVQVWDVETGEPVARVDPPSHDDMWIYIWRFAFLSDSSKMICGDPSGRLYGLDLESETWDEGSWHGEIGNVRAMAFSADGSRLVSAHHFCPEGGDLFPDLQLPVEYQVVVWEVADGRVVHVGREHGNIVTDVAYSPDAQRIASVDLDGTVVLRDGEGLALDSFVPFEPARSLTRVAFSPTGQRLLLGTQAAVVVWDLLQGGPVREITVPGAEGCAFSPDGSLALIGRSLVDLETGETRIVLSEPWEVPLELIPATSFAVGGRRGYDTWLFDLETGNPVQKLDGELLMPCAAYPDGSTLLGVRGSRLYLWTLPEKPE